MKKKQVLNIILISTAIVLTIGMTKGIIKLKGESGKEKQVVKTIVKGKGALDNRLLENVKEEQKSIIDIEKLKDNKSKQVSTKSGFARDYYEKDGELYIVFDEVEFFRDEEAKKEYLKDGNTETPEGEWGNDYYIRNNDKSTNVYKISSNSKLELLSFEIGEDNGIELVTVTEDKIKEKIDKYKENEESERGLLFEIDESNNVVYGMRTIYTP